MRLLITGVSGFLGRHTALAAIKAGHEVVAVGREPLSDEMKSVGAIEFIWPGWPTQILATGLSELITQFGPLDAVIHLAGDPHYGNGPHYYEANVVPTDLLVRSIEQINTTCKFVLASSVGAQDFPRVSSSRLHDEDTKPLPRSDYGRSKLEAEGVVTSSQVDYAIARLGMIVGPGMRNDSHVAVLLTSTSSPLIRRALALWRGFFPLVHIDDAVAALLLMAQRVTPSGTYLVVGSNTPIKTIINIPSGRKKGQGVLSLGVLASFLPAKLATAMSPVMRFDSSKLRAIGWEPRQNIEDAINKVHIELQEPSHELQIVTGVASGLGRAVMEEIILNNGRVIGIDQNSVVIGELKARFSNQTFICADVTDPKLFDQIQRISRQIGSPISSLYLIAGLGSKARFIDHDFDNVRVQFEVNVLARLNLAQRFLQNLKQIKRSGRLVIVSSSTAIQPLPDFAVYGATNAALLSFGRALISETSPNLCQILVIVPGGMDTNFQQTAGVRRLEKERLLNPSIVAKRIVRPASRKSGVQIIGRNARVAQILSRILPWKAGDAIWAYLTKLTR